MHDAGGVRLGQPFGDLPGQVDGPAQGKSALRDRFAQRHPVHELHYDVGAALYLSYVVDGDDVGVIEGRGGPGFPLETAEALGVEREVLPQELEGDVASELQVSRAVDFAHPARADGGHDLVGSQAVSSRELHRNIPEKKVGGVYPCAPVRATLAESFSTPSSTRNCR